MSSQTIIIKVHNPTISTIRIDFDSHGILSLRFNPKYNENNHPKKRVPPFIDALAAKINAYFDGDPVDFLEFPVNITQKTTLFRTAVWNATRTISYGHTMTYAQLADIVATRGHARAVGSALKANPVPLIVPCHRVTAAHGKLGGFSAGPEIKKTLLSLEKL
ncbi:MAG: methylated-DNA--[protein]-cysteine S-methyltransferase [Candidatus Hydrogenedentes bacterium]|nr:methylated-DNA--[protein]-cysteine S-methyltransferase [Candidatus Hydrogenedentota bacterium]